MSRASLEEIKHAWNRRLYKELVLPAIKQASRDNKLAAKKQAEMEARRASLKEQAMINRPFTSKVIRRVKQS